MKLKDKIAIVTGGSSGIGEAICYSYATEGATVIVVNNNHPINGQKVAEKIRQLGGKAEAITCDVGNEQSVLSLIEKIMGKYNRIDILVNNTGLAVFKNFEDHTVEDFDFVVNTNLKGSFLVSRAVVPIMKKQQYGKIIFVSSIAASVGFPSISIYSATKGAMLAMAKSMVAELSKHNININSISPGTTETPGNQAFLTDAEFMKKISQRTASGNAMKPKDIVGAAIFLASDDSIAVHGVDLTVDNAWSSV